VCHAFAHYALEHLKNPAMTLNVKVPETNCGFC
jgi:hypothetical protein